MNRRIRRLIFFIFVFGFLISAPLIVLYTAGYRYNFGTGKIVQTGALSIKSVPKNMEIILDGKKLKGTTPEIINNVFAGEHIIELKKEGYTGWKKTLSIESRGTTFIEKAALFLIEDPQIVVADSITGIHRATGKAIYTISQNQWVETWLYDSRARSSRLLSRLPIDPDAEFVIAWSVDGSAISLKTKSAGKQFFSIINVNSAEGVSVTEMVPGATVGWWDTRRGDVFFAVSKQGVFRIDLVQNQTTQLPENTSIATTDKSGLIIIENVEDRTVVSKFENDQTNIVAFIPLGIYKIHPSPEGILHLEDVERERIILLDSEGGGQPILLNTRAMIWQWSLDGSNRLLYSDGFDLHIYDTKKHADETLTRLSTHIRSVAWDPAADVVFYTQEAHLLATELDHRDGRIVNELLEGTEIQDIWTDEDGDFLFFIGKIGDKSGIFERRLRE